MKPRKNLISFLLIAGSSLLAVSSLHAADGTWTQTTAGPFNWDDIANWSSGAGPIADLADFTANFTANINPAQTVNLNNPKTIGNITFTDSTTSSHDLTISGPNILTLDRTDATKPTIDVTQSGRTLAISSVIGGSDGLLKTGSGDFAPRGLNTFTGGVDLAAGRLTITNNANEASFLGAAANVLTFTGNAELYNVDGQATLPQGITINGSVTGKVTGAFGESTQVDGVLGGSGTLVVQGYSAGYNAEFRNTGNTFTGPIQILSGDGVRASFRSLLDSPGATTIGLQSNGNVGGTFDYMSGAMTPLVLNNRQFELIVNGNSGGFGNVDRQATISSNAATANTITINSDLLITGTGTKFLVLRGGNTGANTFEGDIPDGVSGADLTLHKRDGGKWILSGGNTYEGDTIIADGALEIRGDGQLGAGGVYPGNITSTDTTPSPFTFDSSANSTLGGVISGTMALVKDGAGTLSITGSATQAGGTTVAEGTLSLGNGTNNANLGDLATLSVETGAVLDLNYTGTDTVFFLNLGGSPMAAGQYGHTNSGATNGGAGVGFYDAFFAANTGIINNVNGDTTSLGFAYWDGGSVDIVGNGNASGITNNGTWDTTLQNWDFGFTAHAAWPNTTGSKAFFQRTGAGAHTVTLGSDITLGELDYRGTPNTADQLFFGDASEDNTLNFGGAATITTNDYYVTFRSGITGTPNINYTARQNDNASKLTLAPAGSLTMSLGAVNMIVSPINAKNCILELGGSSAGNSASSVTWSNVAQQLSLNKVGAGTWTLGGGWDNTPRGDSQWKVQGGTLILNGNYNISHRLDVESGGTLKGNATLRVDRTGATEHVRVLAGGTMAPGTSVGTINVNDKTEIAGTLEIEVNGATADLLAITGDLVLSSATDVLTVTELGAATLTDYTVITYTGTRTGTFDTTNLPAGYSVNYDTPGEVHLLVAGGPATPFETWADGTFAGGTLTDKSPGGDDESDGLTNLREFAFGTDPTVNFTGPMEYVAGGNVTTPGQPVLLEEGGTYYAVFGRRKNHVAAGLTYTVQFSADLSSPWIASVDVPTLVTGDPSAGDIEAVRVPFPGLIPTDSGPQKATFFRVEVLLAP